MSPTEILVGYDGSDDARTALNWALNEARQTEQPVRLVYAFEWLTGAGWVGPGLAPGAWPDEFARREADELVRHAITEAEVSHPGVRVRGEVRDGPASLILRDASEHAALLVLGTRGHGGFTGLLAGSTSVTLSGHAHCPVIVVRGRDDGAEHSGPVVVGVDSSDGSLLALGFAIARAARDGVPLRVMRAWAHQMPQWTPTNLHLEDLTAREREAIAEQLAEWQRRYPQVETTIEVPIGNPTEVLVEASRQARLVVVGSRGHGGLRGMLLGSVSHQLIHHAQGPVAVVRELRSQSA